jgi:hypothetical protein
MALKATQVFTPGAFPTRTYVERHGDELELQLKDALDTPGQVVSLVGPSKSGKTVLVEKVVGKESLIPITGAGITHVNDIWKRVLDWMGSPTITVIENGASLGLQGEASTTGGVSLPLIVKGEASVRVGADAGLSRSTASHYEVNAFEQVIKEIGGSSFVVLLDDFHYIPRDVQSEAAKSIKEAVRRGVKVCIAAVQHRGDDLVRANPELRGRVRSIDLHYWADGDLMRIATAGFVELNVKISSAAVKRMVAESAGSPQLMQLLCLNTCFVLGIRERQATETSRDPSDGQMSAIFEQASANTDFRSLVDVIDAGPKTRGTERKTYTFPDGSVGDVYRCVLRAVAADPPRLSYDYAQLMQRTESICKSDSPVGSSVVGTCLHMSKLAQEKFPKERAIDWDEQKQILDIPDPYLLFYLRWSGRLSEPN